MPVQIWAVFLVLTVVEVFIVYRFVREREWALMKAVVPVYLLYTAYMLIAHFLRFKIPDIVMIFTMISLLSHTFLGFFMRLYGTTKTFDRYNHAFGSFAFSLAAYFTLTSLFNEAIPQLLAAIFIFAVGVTLGVFVEIIEFTMDSRKKKDMQLQKGLKDTDFDLIADVIGSAAAGVFACLVLL